MEEVPPKGAELVKRVGRPAGRLGLYHGHHSIEPILHPVRHRMPIDRDHVQVRMRTGRGQTDRTAWRADHVVTAVQDLHRDIRQAVRIRNQLIRFEKQPLRK